MIKHYYVYLFILTLSISCKEETKQDKKALPEVANDSVTTLVLQDSSLLKSDNVRAFVYQDSVYYGHPVFLNKLQTKLVVNAPTMLIQSDEHQTPYLIYPGEQIKIKADKNDSLIFYIDGNAKRSNELYFFRLLVQKSGSIYNFFPSYPYHQTAQSLEKIRLLEKDIYNLKNLRLQLLDSFVSHSPVNDNFIKIALNAIESAALKDSLMLYWSNRILLKKQNIYDKLIIKKLGTIRNIPYQPFVIYFNTCRALVSMATTQYLDYELRDSGDIKSRLLFVESNFDGLTKDFLLANTLYSAYTKGIAVDKRDIQQFYAECSDDVYKQIIFNKVNAKDVVSNPKGNSNLMFADEKTIKDIRDVISEYKGKIILLDFWASWCGPCRAEMPYSEKLRKEYSGKDVAFLYISTDENIQDWKGANEEEGIASENSYLLLNSQTSPFVIQNEMQTIPRYMLINKEGKIINSDAPRPSDPELKKLVDKYLLE